MDGGARGDGYFIAMQRVLSRVPLVSVIGNHEHEGSPFGAYCSEATYCEGRYLNQTAAQLATGFRLPMPVLAIGGGCSYPHARGRGSEPEQSLRRVATNVRGAVIPECGHFVPEEQPAELNRLLLEFFAE